MAETRPIIDVRPGESLREQVLQVVRTRLIAGDLQPGKIYSVSAVAHELGISSSPVREAFLDLTEKGFLEPVRNRGFRVLTVSNETLDEIYYIRELLEVPAMVSLCEDEELEPELAVFDEIVTQNVAAAAAGDAERFLETDEAFHLGLLGLTGRSRLVEIVASLRLQTRLLGIRPLAENDELLTFAEEHTQILSAIRQRNVATVRELMTRHLSHVRTEWAENSEARPGG